MSSYPNGLTLWNAALTRIGEEAVQLNDGSDEDVLYRSSFDHIARNRLSAHQTGFARKVGPLVYQGTTGDSPRYAYALPSDILKTHRVLMSEQPVSDYQIRAEQLVTDIFSDALKIDYTWNVPVNKWSDDFAEAVLTECQSVLYRFYERSIDADRTLQRAEEMYSDVRARDRNAEGGTPVTPRPVLVSAWRRSKATTIRRG